MSRSKKSLPHLHTLSYGSPPNHVSGIQEIYIVWLWHPLGLEVLLTSHVKGKESIWKSPEEILRCWLIFSMSCVTVYNILWREKAHLIHKFVYYSKPLTEISRVSSRTGLTWLIFTVARLENSTIHSAPGSISLVYLKGSNIILDLFSSG